MRLLVHADGILEFGAERFRCALGKASVRRAKREGDGATPAGIWTLRRVLYRADRGRRPRTALPVAPIGARDGWCDWPGDPAYNRPVQLPYPARCETLRRADGLYDILVVLGFNDAPVIPGKGSAIFFHLASRDYRPTEGCVAVQEADMRRVLERAGPGSLMEIRAP